MTVREFKERRGVTLEQLTNEFRTIEPKLDMPLVSRMVTGVVNPSDAVQEYINLYTEGFANMDYADDPLEELFLQDLLTEVSRFSIAYPCDRRHLVLKFGKPDRTIRRGIEELRRRGNRIVSNAGRYGYWLDSKGGGYDRMRSEMRSKAFSILKTLNAMDRKELEGQITWEVQQ